MTKKVAVIFGGPRRESNTHILVKEALKGLEDSGAQGEIFFLNDMSLKGCQSCNYCKTNNTADCAVKDDMGKIHVAMEQADGIIVASPVYFGNVTSQTRTWIDRLYCYVGGHAIPGKKPVAFIFTQNQPDAKMFQASLDVFMNMTKLAGLEPAGQLLVPDLSKGAKPMVTEYPDRMKAAYDMGKTLLSR